MQSPPVALTIAGSDSSAGAGAQADLKTFAAFGVYGVTAITCVVAEAPGRVHRIDAVEAASVRAQIDVLFASFPIGAVKTGLLQSREIVEAVAESILQRKRQGSLGLPLVIDPVMIATSGDRLLDADALEMCEQKLFPLATLLTPNLDEAAALLGRPVSDLDGMRSAGRALQEKYGVAVLLKGGHLRGDDATDLLFDGTTVREFSAPFSRNIATHGTGCTYSAAIAAGLARGVGLEEAIAEAKRYVTRTIAQHFTWTNSQGSQTHALRHAAQ